MEKSTAEPNIKRKQKTCVIKRAFLEAVFLKSYIAF